MQIKEFMASKCAYIYDSFAKLPKLDIKGLRLVCRVSNEIGLIYDCYFLGSSDLYSQDIVLECRIMFEHDIKRISIDCSQLPQMKSLDDYMLYFEQFEVLERELNLEYTFQA